MSVIESPVVEVAAPAALETTSQPPTGHVLGVGVDLVHVPTFAEQLDVPGSRFAGVFTPGERSDVAERVGDARHWAVRWAAKEAVVKAWSTSLFGEPAVMGDEVFALIETVTDAWGRPRVRLHGEVARHLADCSVDISLSHDGDHAIAYVVLSHCEFSACSR
jgi:holo-[acyl-carrier protein] synthase